ncbi:MAG: hypothetical protein U5L96_13095 [Owenweeksia sp.]|nr:hypothetical protein [Owenweeksia sp.]
MLHYITFVRSNASYMADVYHELSRIQTLAYELVQKYEEALNENESLKASLEGLQGELTEEKRKMALLEEELKTAKLARGLAGSEEESGMAKARISTLVREIDRCIAMLNE